jgi:sigma-B regulation protein RsbU (phosphoserine phosphatase)
MLVVFASVFTVYYIGVRDTLEGEAVRLARSQSGKAADEIDDAIYKVENTLNEATNNEATNNEVINNEAINIDTIKKILSDNNPFEHSVLKLFDKDSNLILEEKSEDVLSINFYDEDFVFSNQLPETSLIVTMEVDRDEIFYDWYFLSGIMLLIAIAGIIIICFLVHFVVKKTSSPLKAFSNAAKEIASGSFDNELPVVETHDEVGELRNSFDFMQVELKKYISSLREVTAKKEQIESELKIARGIQMAMLPDDFPPFPLRKDIDIYAVLEPAKAVGGDFYDYIFKGDNLYFVIGDVSGKGVPASLFMAVTRSLFRANIEGYSAPFAPSMSSVSSVSSAPFAPSAAEIMTSLNNMLCKISRTNMFVTLFTGCLNVVTGRLSYCNAGHNPPVLLSSKNIGFMDVATNIPASVQEDFLFKGGEITLQKEDTIFLYTDGVTEAENRNQDFFSDDNLIKFLSCSDGLMPQKYVKDILSAVREFADGTEQNDDITMLAITYYPPLQYNITIENRIENFTAVYEFLEKWLEFYNVKSDVRGKINLAVEEAVVNVISHAYTSDNSPSDISVEFVVKNGLANIIISDSGISFNPLNVEKQNITLSPEERPIGGLGIHLIRELSDDITYHRKSNKNILTLRFKI